MVKLVKSRILHTLSMAVLLGAGVVLTSAPANASATTMTINYALSGSDLVITYWSSDNADTVTVDIPAGDANPIVFHDANVASMTLTDNLPGTPCSVNTVALTITCPKSYNDSVPTLRKVIDVGVIGNDGDDALTATGDGMVYGSNFRPIHADLAGSAGEDTLISTGGYSSLVGGADDDTITSGPGKSAGGSQFTDFVSGGGGNDTIDTASTHSPDADGIYCDDQVDVAPDPDNYLTDSLVKSTGDTELRYSLGGGLFLDGGCDSVTTA